MHERLLSQLAHVEVLTPTPEESLRFYADVLGLEESARDGRSVYLRGWGERFHHSLQLTEADEPGLGHVAWRAHGPEQLEEAAPPGEAAGAGEGWAAGPPGQGATHRDRGPSGAAHQPARELQRYKPPAR